MSDKFFAKRHVHILWSGRTQTLDQLADRDFLGSCQLGMRRGNLDLQRLLQRHLQDTETYPGHLGLLCCGCPGQQLPPLFPQFGTQPACHGLLARQCLAVSIQLLTCRMQNDRPIENVPVAPGQAVQTAGQQAETAQHPDQRPQQADIPSEPRKTQETCEPDGPERIDIAHRRQTVG